MSRPSYVFHINGIESCVIFGVNDLHILSFLSMLPPDGTPFYPGLEYVVSYPMNIIVLSVAVVCCMLVYFFDNFYRM